MTAAALLSRDTALADVRRRPKELHHYGDTLADALILRNNLSGAMQHKVAREVLHELTTFDRSAGGRAIAACAGIPGLIELFVLIMKGHHRASLAEVAAIGGVSVSAAQLHMAALREAGILRAPEIGRKGESVTRYEIGPVGAQMMRAAHARLVGTKAIWDRWWTDRKAGWAKRKAAKGSRRPDDQHARKRNRESPPSIRTGPTVPAPVVNAGRVALALGQTGQECEHGALPGRCAFCRRLAAAGAARSAVP